MPSAYDPNEDPQAQQNAQPGQNAPQLAGGSQVVGGSAATASGGSAAANQTPGSSPGSSSSGSGSQSTAGGGQVQSNPNPTPTSSGAFQNLNSYLAANQGNGFGQQFVGDVNNTVNQAQSAQQQGLQSFESAADAGTTQQNNAAVQQAVDNPYATSQNPAEEQAFQSQLNAQYLGPSTFSADQAAYQQAAGATQQAADTAQAAGTESGRFALLNNYFGNANYNQGDQSLDNLLIQANPTTQQGIQQAQQNANAAQTSLQGLMPTAANYAANDAAITQATAANALNAGNTAVTDMTNQYNTQLTNDQTAAQQAAANLAILGNSSDQNQWASILSQYGVAPGSISDPLLQQGVFQAAPSGLLGPALTGGQLAGVATPTATSPIDSGYFGINPAGTYNGNSLASLEAAPTLSSATTLTQQQNLDALQSMLDQAQTTFDPTQAGTFNPANAITFNSAAYNSALNNAEQAYLAAESPIMQQISQNNNASAPLTPGTIMPGAYAASLNASDLTQLNQIRANYGLPPVTEDEIENYGRSTALPNGIPANPVNSPSSSPQVIL